MTSPYDRRHPRPREGWPPQGARRPQPKPKGFSPARVLFFGVLGLVLGELVKWWQDSLSPVFVSLCTVGVAMIPLLVDYARSSREEPTRGPGHAGYPEAHRPAPHRRGGALLVGILVLVVLGGGAAYGISWAVGRVTGNETVIADRLAEQVTGTADTLSVTVTSVEVTDHFTKVGVSAQNNDAMTVLISVWANAQLVDDTGQSLEPVQGFAMSDDIDVPANGIVVRDVITFDGRLAPEATTATLIFGVLMARGFDFDANSLQVENIRVTPLPE